MMLFCCQNNAPQVSISSSCMGVGAPAEYRLQHLCLGWTNFSMEPLL